MQFSYIKCGILTDVTDRDGLFLGLGADPFSGKEQQAQQRRSAKSAHSAHWLRPDV